MVLLISSLIAKFLRSALQKQWSKSFFESGERYEDHGGLEDRCGPEHPTPSSAFGHETTDNWAYQVHQQSFSCE